jgi:hypothetical protein
LTASTLNVCVDSDSGPYETGLPELQDLATPSSAHDTVTDCPKGSDAVNTICPLAALLGFGGAVVHATAGAFVGMHSTTTVSDLPEDPQWTSALHEVRVADDAHRYAVSEAKLLYPATEV